MELNEKLDAVETVETDAGPEVEESELSEVSCDSVDEVETTSDDVVVTEGSAELDTVDVSDVVRALTAKQKPRSVENRELSNI